MVDKKRMDKIFSAVGLDMERLAGMNFDVAGFSNFSRDHLGFHGNMENYALAKQKLFTQHLYPHSISVVNCEHPRFRAKGWSAAPSDLPLNTISSYHVFAYVSLTNASHVAQPSSPLTLKDVLREVIEFTRSRNAIRN